MEYCEGGDLFEKIYNKKELYDERQVSYLKLFFYLFQMVSKFFFKKILDWLFQIADALKYLNEKNIAHRDIKLKVHC